MASKYNTEWIIENYQKYSKWSEMLVDYNKVFKTNFTRSQFKAKCHDLGLKTTKYFFSDEQREWLSENYPQMKTDEMAALFNEVFGTNKSSHTIKEFCVGTLKLKKNEDVLLEIRKEQNNALKLAHDKKRKPVGYVGRPSNDYLYVKTGVSEWKPYARYVYESVHGAIPDDNSIIFLNGNNRNFDIDNLVSVPKSYQFYMNRVLKISQGNKELTKTAIKWCELRELVESEED